MLLMAYENFITFFQVYLPWPTTEATFVDFSVVSILFFAFVLTFACQPCAKVNSVSAHSTGKGQVGSPSPTWPAYSRN